jgi:hypothetical protein
LTEAGEGTGELTPFHFRDGGFLGQIERLLFVFGDLALGWLLDAEVVAVGPLHDRRDVVYQR